MHNQASVGSRSFATTVKVIAAMDFFTVPTITFGVLFCFFVITHDTRMSLTSLTHVARMPDQLVVCIAYL